MHLLCALQLCVTADGKVADSFAPVLGRRLDLIDSFVQMALIGNRAKALLRDLKDMDLLQELLEVRYTSNKIVPCLDMCSLVCCTSLTRA